MPKLVRTATRGLMPAPEDLRQRLAHPEWFHIQEKEGVTNLTVNMLRVPPPQRSLVANVSAVAREGRTVSMILGQRLPGGKQMHGALAVGMSTPAVHQTIYSSAEFLQALDAYADRHEIQPQMRTPEPDTYPPERVVVERASILAISFSEDETELRFYRTSATDMRIITMEKAGQAGLLYPVVEVVMGTPELVHLIHSLKAAVPRGEEPK